jgi:hypothetical protein
MYQVKKWKMTEEERLAYIAKHPIKPFVPYDDEKKQGLDFTGLDTRRKKKKTFN